jgi:hypothetical protein
VVEESQLSDRGVLQQLPLSGIVQRRSPLLPFLRDMLRAGGVCVLLLAFISDQSKQHRGAVQFYSTVQVVSVYIPSGRAHNDKLLVHTFLAMLCF